MSSFPTLYVYGDVPLFYQMLNATAEVFKSNLFSGGGTVMLLGGLVTLIILGLKAINPQARGFRVEMFFLIFLFYYTGINVTETVTIEDVFSGSVEQVANIPVFIAAPAGIFSAAAYAITQDVETAFSVPVPSWGMPTPTTFASLGSGGFENPLLLLGRLRNDLFFSRDAQNISNFELYCAIGNPNFDHNKLIKSSNAAVYMTGLSNLLGLTVYYDSLSPKGATIACADAATLINNDLNAYTILTTPSALLLENAIQGKMAYEQPTMSSTATSTTDINALTAAYNNIVGGSAAMTAAGGATDFMSNMMFLDVIYNTFKCADNSGSKSNFQMCTEAISQRTALEQSKTDNAGAASLFERAMFPTMNLLLMLFFGLAPLVAMVAVMSPETTVKVLGSYILFGVWTQSWLPVAAIINYYIQLQAQTSVGIVLAQAPFSMENMQNFYDVVSLKVSLGSQMLAATPLITMSILSGSMFAMTRIAEGIGGKDHFDETLASPNLATGNAVTQVGPRNTGHQINDLFRGTRGNTNQANVFSDTYKRDITSSSEQSLGDAKTYANAAATKEAISLAHLLGSGVDNKDLRQTGLEWAKTTSEKNSEIWGQAQKLTDTLVHGTNITGDAKKSIAGIVAGGLQAGATAEAIGALVGGAIGTIIEPGGGTVAGIAAGEALGKMFSGSHVGLTGQDAVSEDDQKKVARNFDHGFTSDYKSAVEKSTTTTGGAKQSQNHSDSSGFSKKDQETFKQDREASVQAQHQLSVLKKASQSQGSSVTMNGAQFVDAVTQDKNLRDTIDSTYNGLTDNKALVDARAQALYKTMGVSETATDGQKLNAIRAARADAMTQLGGKTAVLINTAIDEAKGYGSGVPGSSAVTDNVDNALADATTTTSTVKTETGGVPAEVSPAKNLTPRASKASINHGPVGADPNRVPAATPGTPPPLPKDLGVPHSNVLTEEQIKAQDQVQRFYDQNLDGINGGNTMNKVTDMVFNPNDTTVANLGAGAVNAVGDAASAVAGTGESVLQSFGKDMRTLGDPDKN